MNIDGKQNIISANIMQLMNLHDVTEAELARRTGIPQTTVNRLLTKGLDAKTNTLKPIAHLFNLTVSHLIGEIPLDLSNLNFNLSPNRISWSNVPIISWEQVPGWRFIQDQIHPSKYKFIVTEKNISENSFAIFSRPFMAPLFREHSVLIIDPKKELHDGVYVLLSFGNEEPTVRIVNFDGSKVFIRHPIRANEPVIEMDKTIFIHGIIIECRINVDVTPH